jgi:polyether ionophore transport system ATP-binding protein
MGIAIRAAGLSQRYGPVSALTGLDLQIAEGEVFGYLGPDGAGKTTTLRLLLGLAQPAAGYAQIFGLDCWGNAVAVHRRLAYVPAEASLWPWLTGAETLHLLSRGHRRPDLRYRDELIERFALDPAREIHACSRSNRQKVLLIAAFLTRADLLLLDEPARWLDPQLRQEFRRCVGEARSRGQTVFLSSRTLSEIEVLCDRVGILSAGELVATGTPEQLRHLSPVVVEAVFDMTLPSLTGVPGVRRVEVTGRHLRLEVQGPVAPVIGVLTGAGVRSLVCREPSLEEVFLAHYGEAPVPVAAASASPLSCDRD